MENMITFLIAIVPATITSIVSYMVSKSETKAKIVELSNNYELKLNEINAALTQQESNHIHELQLLNAQFELQAKQQNNDMSSEMAKKFISGDLDISQIMKNMGPLIEMNDLLNKTQK